VNFGGDRPRLISPQQVGAIGFIFAIHICLIAITNIEKMFDKYAKPLMVQYCYYGARLEVPYLTLTP
jgi:hypothetical protein